ncbi:MAG TPA: hypothetical protein VEA61_02140 [Allosphingosinicella sp.]|nr:hypothetical protein [Allosphingosinicella sp.]
MKSLMIAALVAAQALTATQPAFAAELNGANSAHAPQVGAFAGARVRVPIGGRKERMQAGLAMTSALRTGATGELRFAKGAELGFSGGDPAVRLTLAGMPVSRLVGGGAGPQGRKHGISTLGWIAIGVGAAVIIVVAAAAACAEDSDCLPSE